MHGTKTRPQPIRHSQRRLLVAFTFFLTLLVAGSALADRVKWRKTKVEESSGSWRIDLEFYMNRAPDIALVPMRFEFENTVYYERALVDGKEEPIDRTVPLVGKTPPSPPNMPPKPEPLAWSTTKAIISREIIICTI